MTDLPAGYRDAQGRCGTLILDAKPEAFAFDAASTALIVVDMQNAYATKGGYLDLAGFDVSAVGPVIAQTSKAVAAARRRNSRRLAAERVGSKLPRSGRLGVSELA